MPVNQAVRGEPVEPWAAFSPREKFHPSFALAQDEREFFLN